MRKPSKTLIRTEIFDGEKAKCFQCQKAIVKGDQVIAARRRSDGKLVWRACSQNCVDEGQYERFTSKGM